MEPAVLTCRFIEAVDIPRKVDQWHGRAIFERVNRIISKSTKLSATELEAAKEVFGPDAIKFEKVRAAEGGIVELILSKLLGCSAVTLFHTMNFPGKGRCTRQHPGIVIHELTHVLQYERLGSGYITECLEAQKISHYHCYDYIGPNGLREAKSAGKQFKNFNREQQACIAEQYFNDVIKNQLDADHPDREIYETYINEMRKGNI